MQMQGQADGVAEREEEQVAVEEEECDK